MFRICVGLFLGWSVCSKAEEVRPVEGEVRKAFEEALENLPEALREQVGDVAIDRAADLGVPAEGPLEYQLLNRAAFASFSVNDRVVSVYDAGAKEVPSWGQEAPAAEDVAKFLAGVADVLGVEAPGEAKDEKLEKAWAAFVREVYSWREEELPDPVPPLGDPEVLDRFLADGVWILMGGEVAREEMIFHELGHALHLKNEFASLASGMLFWATLSGFTETRDGEATDGFVGGMNSSEDAMVLIRLLLSDGPEKMPRGEKALYEVSKEARFVNRYARYDLREDYAESFRLMGYYPERLVELAPEKFLYLNALGWNARLDGKKPGPLWYSGDDFQQLIPKEERKVLFERLLGKNGKGPALHPIALAAVLRAHAGELTAEDFPEAYAVLEVPRDLPEDLREGLGPELLTAEIGGVVHVASPELQIARQDEVIGDWVEAYEFETGIFRLWGQGAEGLLARYEEDVVSKKDAAARANSYEAFREVCLGEVPEEAMRKMDRQEAEFQKEAGRVWAAARFAVLGQEGDAAGQFAMLEEVAKRGAPQGYDRVIFSRTAADVALRTGEEEVIRSKVGAIPGKTLGAWLRTAYWLRAAEGGDGNAKAGYVAAAKDEAAACQYPMLQRRLRLMVKEAGE